MNILQYDLTMRGIYLAKESKKMIKLTDQAKEHLNKDENIEFKVLGAFDGKINGKTVYSNGIFLATDKRLFFYGKKHNHSFNYKDISSVELIEKKMVGPTIIFYDNNDKVSIQFAEQGNLEGFVKFLKHPVFDETGDFSQFAVKQTSRKKTAQVKQIKETKCSCSACGNIWYYGKGEAMENFGEKMENFGKSMSNTGTDMMCCGGCLPALFIPDKQVKEVKDFNKCPECGSKAIKKEIVVHNVE